MTRCKLLLSWATLLGFLCSMTATLGVRQRSVESCGPHPLIALAAASRPFASSSASLNDLIRAVRADPDVWTEMQILLRRYDDCIRAGDGLHYKRGKLSGTGSGSPTGSSSSSSSGGGGGGGDQLLPFPQDYPSSANINIPEFSR